MAAKALLWAYWGIESAVAIVFVALALACFGSVSHVKLYAANYEGYFLNALLSSLILSAVLVLLFFALSLVFLVKKQAYHQEFAGFTHGFNLASSFFLSLFVLLACIVLTSGKTELNQWHRYDAAWNTGTSILYYATFIIGYILAGLYMGHAILFLCLRHAFDQVVADVENKHHNKPTYDPVISEKPSYAQYTPTTSKPDTAAPTTAPPEAAAPPAKTGGFFHKNHAPAPAPQAEVRPAATTTGGGLHGPSSASPFHKETVDEPVAAT